MNEQYSKPIYIDPVRRAEMQMHDAHRAMIDAKRYYETCRDKYVAMAQAQIESR